MAAPLTGWFTKEAEKVGAARRRFFELRGAVVTYFERERDGKGVNKKGTIDITIGSNASGEGRDLLIQTPARTYVLKAEDAEVAKKWRRALVELIAKISATVDKTPISGWLLKEAEGVGRARRRFFVCEGAFVKYYDGENLAAALLKGRIKIGATSFISNEETRIKITNPEREWQLTAPDSITAARWVAELGDIRSSREGVAGPDDASDGDDEPPDDRFLMPGRGVWLLKDGTGLGGALRGPQRRFFALLYGSDPHMVKFAYFRGVESGQPRGLRGFVPIMPESTIEEAEGGIIITNPDRTWTLETEDEEDAPLWTRLLRQSQAAIPPRAAAPPAAALDTTGSVLAETRAGDSSAAILGPNGASSADAPSVSKMGARGPGARMSLSGLELLETESEDGPAPSAVSLRIPSAPTPASPSPGDRSSGGFELLQSHAPAGRSISATVAAPTAAPLVQSSASRQESLSSSIYATGINTSGAPGVWLTKQAERFGASRRRYFVVRPGLVEYYADAACEQQRGRVDLACATVAVHDAHVTIGAQGREWMLRADDAAAATAWAERVRAAVPLGEDDVSLTPFTGEVRIAGARRVGELGADGLLRLRLTADADALPARVVPVLRGTLLSTIEAQIVMVNTDDVFEMTAPTVESAQAWLAALKAARAAAGTLRPPTDAAEERTVEGLSELVCCSPPVEAIAPRKDFFLPPETAAVSSSPLDPLPVAATDPPSRDSLHASRNSLDAIDRAPPRTSAGRSAGAKQGGAGGPVQEGAVDRLRRCCCVVS